jgi:hypothetical protein
MGVLRMLLVVSTILLLFVPEIWQVEAAGRWTSGLGIPFGSQHWNLALICWVFWQRADGTDEEEPKVSDDPGQYDAGGRCASA